MQSDTQQSAKRAQWHARMEQQTRNRPREERVFNAEKAAHTKRLRKQKVTLAPIGECK